MTSELYNDVVPRVTDAVLDRDGKWERGEVRFRCPSGKHQDLHPSARWNPEKAVWRCDSCHAGGGAVDLANRFGLDIRRHDNRGGGGGVIYPRKTPATLQHSRQTTQNPASSREFSGQEVLHTPVQRPVTAQRPGLTLAAYAEAKAIPIAFLRGLGVSELHIGGSPAVRIPYRNPDGTEAAIRYRLAMEGPDRFRWKRGAKPMLYGLDRLAAYDREAPLILVEGESDCHTLWLHGVQALGLPGAGTWREEWAPLLDGFTRIFVVIEPDSGGEAVKGWLAQSAIRDRAWLIDPGEVKDVSNLHIAGAFAEAWPRWLTAAEKWANAADRTAKAEAAAAWELCKGLALEPDITALAADVLEASGLVGVRREARLLYLVVTSRLLGRPISAVLKGPSSGGKSFLVERVLALFPDAAYYALSAMSERSLAYSEEPLAHRTLVLYEAAGLNNDFGTYLLRSLISEGRVRYETVEKTSDGMRPRLIERPGPTGLITTTTRTGLDPELETRLLTIPVPDDREQTARIMAALATDLPAEPDLTEWHTLQRWLAGAAHEVTIPFAEALASLIPPVATRLRRDFTLVLNLIRANAVLHQARRERDERGRIVATLDDYRVVYGLVADLLSAGVETTVTQSVRETVAAVAGLVAPAGGRTDTNLRDQVRDGWAADEEPAASITAIAKHLGLDKSTVSRRVSIAVGRGYLRNLEDKRGRPYRIALGDSLPDDQPLLPSPEQLRERCSDADRCNGVCTTSEQQTPSNHAESAADSGESCSVASGSEGILTPIPPLARTDPETGYESEPDGWTRPACAMCGAPLMTPESIAHGVCTPCWESLDEVAEELGDTLDADGDDAAAAGPQLPAASSAGG